MTTEKNTPPDIDARFYTLQEAAAILNVNPSTLSRQCNAGTFPHVRIGRTVRIPVAEVDRLERGEPMRASVLDVPDYVTSTPSMFDGTPEADSPEDDPCQWDPMCAGIAEVTITDAGKDYRACAACADDVVSGDAL